MAPSSNGATAPALAVSTVIFTLRTCETGEMKLALAFALVTLAILLAGLIMGGI